jgi:ribosomal protein S18 acetylase RimI-like enzyme
VSLEVEAAVVERGDDGWADAAWALKERIRAEEGVLRQRRTFFERAYRRARVHLYHADDELVGFAATRTDGYILFLAVDPAYRGEGFGERLVAAVAEESDTVTCHARASNEAALGFYRHLGFEEVRHIANYYEDGGDAYYLRLGDGGGGLRERLSGLLGG